MCGIILLILGIVYATRIPKLLRSTPAEFGDCDPNLHAQWRSKELASIYVFLAATWGQYILFFLIGIGVGVALARRSEAELNSAIVMLTAAELLVFLIGLVWAGILGSQAAKLKKQLITNRMPPSYYPRPGQVTLQAPPQSPVSEAPPQMPMVDTSVPEAPQPPKYPNG